MRLKLLLQSWKSINLQFLIIFGQKWFNYEMKHCLWPTDSLILFGIGKNCLIKGESLILYQRTGIMMTGCKNYRGISLLSISYKILSNILLSGLIPFKEEITGDHKCGFRCNTSTTNQILSICQILEKKKLEYNETVHQLFIHCRKPMIQWGGKYCTILSCSLEYPWN
jgi:hypothetical protein